MNHKEGALPEFTHSFRRRPFFISPWFTAVAIRLEINSFRSLCDSRIDRRYPDACRIRLPCLGRVVRLDAGLGRLLGNSQEITYRQPLIR